MRSIARRVVVVALLGVAILSVAGLAAAAEPTITNPQPEDGEKFTTRTVVFNATVDDSDFSSGETVDVFFYIDNNLEYQETISSKTNVSYTHTFSSGGDHGYYILAEDTNGRVAGTSTRTISIPGTLRIENATNPNTLITNTTEVEFYGENEVYTKNTSDGTLNLTGLPEQDYVLESDVDGTKYYDGTQYILNPFDNATVYHLNTNTSTVQSRFTIRDQTGVFKSGTVVQVQRYIETSGRLLYTTVTADRVGNEGFTTRLEAGQRYRIRIIDEERENFQVVGPYRADVSETVTLEPGDPSVNVGNFSDGWQASVEQIDVTSSGTKYEITYVDSETATDSLEYYLQVNYYDGSSTRTPSRFAVNLGSLTNTITLSNDTQKANVILKLKITRYSETFDATRQVARQRTNAVPVNLNDGLLQILSGLLLLLTAGLFSQDNHRTGAVVIVALAGVLWVLSLLGGMVTGSVLITAALIAILYKLAGNR